MADPLSVATGVTAFVSFSLSASKALYEAIENIKKQPKVIRELKTELESLQQVLKELKEVVDNSGPAQFASLHSPLENCGIACNEFADTVLRCTKNSTETHSSFRDMAKMTYLGSDITSFKDTIGSYKSTIQIALGGMSIQTSTVTSGLLQEYIGLIADTKTDLQDRLENIDEKLQQLSAHHLQRGEIIQRDRIQEERESVERCLEICNEVSTCIAQQRPKVVQNASTTSNEDTVPGAATDVIGDPSSRLTAASLGVCGQNISTTKLELEARLREIDKRLDTTPLKDQERLQDQKASIQECLAICGVAATEAEKARINVFEDVGAAEDSQQIIVSTMGDLISARRVTVGAGSLQLMGQMNDDSVQYISGKRSEHTGGVSSPNRGDNEGSKFEGRHGTGRNLGKSGSPSK